MVNKPSIQAIADQEYKYGFVTDIEQDRLDPGLNEDVIRMISSKKSEPKFMLEWRLRAYKYWLTMKEPSWQNIEYPQINYDDITYYAAPKRCLLYTSPRPRDATLARMPSTA